MSTIKVKPWGKGQGDFVLIDEADFDPEFHQRFEDKPAKPRGQRNGASDEDQPADQG